MKKSLLTFAMAAFLCGMQANADNVFTAASVEGAPGETVNIELKLASDAAVAGFQANIAADKEGLTLGTATVTGAATLAEAWIGSNAVTTTSYNLLSYSQNCSTFASNEEKIVAVIPVTIPENAEEGEYTFTIGNGIVSDSNGTASLCTNGTFKVIVKPAAPNFDFNGNDRFDIDDIELFLDAILMNDTSKATDINGDGAINIDDVEALLDILLMQ